METTLTKQKDILNGNEAYLIGIDRNGSQVWLEVLEGTELKCELFKLNEINLFSNIVKPISRGLELRLLNGFLNEYLMKIKFLNKHPEQMEYRNGLEMQVLVKDILNLLKPTT